jgi:metallo-beta-lactamase family protein
MLDVDGHRVLFSGDLGRPHHPLLVPRSNPVACDTVVVESTYGDRTHPPAEPNRLADAVNRTIRRHGVVLIPAFAVDRTELVLLQLRRLMRSGKIPQVPVYLDSPMALAALDVYRQAVASPNAQIRADLSHRGDIFNPGDLRIARSAQESQRLNRPASPCIIVSASGMGTGGRVVHHLAHQLPDPRNTVVLTGYQAEGTRGRQLLEGARQVKIHGRYVPVRAEVVDAQDFSVHSDADETLDWLRSLSQRPGTAYVVHGEPTAARQLADRIDRELGWNSVVPTYGEKVRLD